MKLRRATLDDAPALLALVERAYRGEPSRAGWTTEADLLDGQRTDLDDVHAAIGGADSVVLVGERDGVLVGCVRITERPEAPLVGMFAVEPTQQNAGLGRALLSAAEEHVRRELGADRARMWVLRQRTELIDWYLRRGWADVGATEPFPYGDARYGLPRRPDLLFCVLEKQLRGAELEVARGAD